MDELIQLDKQILLLLNGSHSVFIDNLMHTFTNTFAWSLLIVVLLYVLFKNNTWKEAMLILLCIGLMIATADLICSAVVKPTVARWRPARDPELMYLIDTVRGYRGGRFGFFSGHACNTFCTAMFLSCLFGKTRATLVLFLWAVVATFTRLYLGVHYPGDVLVGWSVGLIIGWLFYRLYSLLRSRFWHGRLISEQFTSTGYLLSDINLFIAAVFFNYILLFIFSACNGIH